MVTISHCKWQSFTWNLKEKSSLLHLCPWEVVVQWVSVLLSWRYNWKKSSSFLPLPSCRRDLVFSRSCIYFFVLITSCEKAICFSLSSHSSLLDHLRVQQLFSLALVSLELKSHLFWMAWCFSEDTSLMGKGGPARSGSEAGDMFSWSFGTSDAWIG